MEPLIARSEIPVVHIYAQRSHHMEAVILGNKQGLEALRDAITIALSVGYGCNGMGQTGVYVNDGEGYDIEIKVIEEIDIDKLPVPYTEDYAQDKTGISPTSFLK